MAEHITAFCVFLCCSLYISRICFENDMELLRGRWQWEVRLLIIFGLLGLFGLHIEL